MSLFSDNIRHLRVKKDVSQEIVAENLSISRDSLAKYEQGKSQPPHEILIRISRYYHVSIDLLLTADIRKINIESLLKLDDNRILLPIMVDSHGDNIIEIVPHKAKAGYLAGYSDPEFIGQLPQISLPFLGNGKFRAMPIDGDSMPPHRNSSYIIGKYQEDRNDIREGKTYVFLTKDEGIVYKRIQKKDKEYLTLQSDNAFYQPYTIHFSEVLEIWKYAGSIETEEFEPDSLEPQNIRDMLHTITNEIKALKQLQP
ncbi:XRE family transcriptional regulator [Flavobacterium sp. RHBU_24]|uniref:XRE family transcriptional regulator n=1 Tax=Flavobacterium sp. RHBU_24 TaxID=3391185 RepID=UPI003984D8C5